MSKERKATTKPRAARLERGFTMVFLCLLFVFVLPVFLQILFGVNYLPSPAWVQLSNPYATGLGFIVGIAVFASLIFWIRKDGNARPWAAVLSLREKALCGTIVLFSPVFLGFLVTDSITKGFPILLTAIIGSAKTEEYSFASASLGGRGCWERMDVQETDHPICGISAPPNWQAGDKIIVAGKGSYFGVFVDSVMRADTP